jgi:hypothetical protein
MDFPIEIVLEYPFEYGGEKVDKVVIARRPAVKDIRGIGNLSPTDQTIKIIEKVAGLAPSVVDKISLTDLGKISELVASFL